MDYRDFLGKATTMVLPYLGGPSVSAPDRRLRVTERVAVGWWQCSVQGRHATPTEPVDPPELDALPRVRGHLVDDWLFASGDTAHRLWLMPEERPEVLTPAVGRRWYSGDHLYDTTELEDEAVDVARTRLQDGEVLGDLAGVPPALRAAFGYALLVRTAAERDLRVSVREVLGRTHEIASGILTPDHFLQELEARRFQTDPTHHISTPIGRRRRVRQPSADPTVDNATERAAAVLEAAGATLLDTRPLGGRNLEVVFRYADERFKAIVDWQTLHVYDSGICLDGHDEALGLDALPSVIAEAIATHQLHITAR